MLMPTCDLLIRRNQFFEHLIQIRAVVLKINSGGSFCSISLDKPSHTFIDEPRGKR